MITWLALEEEFEFKTVSLKNFYIRRTLRIWPVYLAYVIVLAILQFSGIAIQHRYAWRGILTFTRNLYDTQWTVGGGCQDYLSYHFWSLSVEEQFYLFWPLIFRLFAMSGRIWFLASAVVFSIGFKTVYLLGWHDRSHVILFQDCNTFNYLDSLAWGCLGAIALFIREAGTKRFFERNGPALFSIGLSMIVIPGIAGIGKTVQNFGFAILLLHSIVSPDWLFYRVLSFKWMNRIGILSYSIYIWQQIIWIMWPAILLPVWFLWIPLVFGLAWISYQFLEKPFFALRAKFRNPVTNKFPAPMPPEYYS